MSSFKLERIVVPTSFSEKSNVAIQSAIGLADRAKAKILLVHIIEPSITSTKITATGQETIELKKQANEKLKEISLQILRVSGLEVGYKVYSDTLYSGICRAVTYFDSDLIMMGHEHNNGLCELWKGSNADRVSIYSKVPVLSVGNPDPDAIKVILYPFNEDMQTLEKKLEQVKTLAKLYKAMIHIAAFRNSDKALNKSKIYLRTKRVGENILQAGIWCSTHLSVGNDYAREMLDFAQRLNPDLIAVAVYPSKDKRRLFASASFKKLVNRSKISVLSIPMM